MESESNKEIVLVSFVRAGVPLGILLHLAIQKLGGVSVHYGISIIRDRGIDDCALSFIEQKHGKENIFFVDGWTGKGAITKELRSSLSSRTGYPEIDRLVVLSDICGSAWLSASMDDWLIPFGILGAPVSGLVSRSIYNHFEFHGCLDCQHLSDYDQSVTFIQKVIAHWGDVDLLSIQPACKASSNHALIAEQSQQVIKRLSEQYQIKNINRIKPGIAEATRAVLRRLPDHVLISSLDDENVALLLYLTQKLNIPVQVVGSSISPYNAVTIIKKVGKE